VTRPEIRLATLIASLALLDLAVWFIAVPLIPFWEREIGMSHLQSGLVLGSYSLAVLMLSIPAGHLGDRIGPRRLTIAATFLFAATTPLFAFADTFWQLLVLRFVNGMFSAVSWTAGLAWLVASVPPTSRTRAMTLVNAAASPAGVIGPLLGGPVVHYLGLKPTLVGLGVLILGFAIWALLEPQHGGEEITEHESAIAALRIGLTVPGIRQSYLGIGFASLAFGSQQLLATVHMDDLGLSEAGIGWVFTAGAAISVAAAVFLSREAAGHDKRGMGRSGVACVTAVLVYLAIVTATGPFVAGVVAMAGLGTIMWVSFYPLCSESADTAGIGQGVALGGLNTVWAAFSIVAPVVAGFLSEHGGDSIGYLFVAGVGLVVVVALRPAVRSPA
jgi:MFS family permease